MAEMWEIAFAIESQKENIARAVQGMARQAREQERLERELEAFRRRHGKPKTVDEEYADFRDFLLRHPHLCERDALRQLRAEARYLRNSGHPRYRLQRAAMIVALPLLCLVVAALQLAGIVALILHVWILP